MAARHRAFIAPRLVGGLSALAALPVFLAARGVPSTLEFIVLVWMVVPLATACYLSRTGRYESAHVLSALSLTGIASTVAAYSGGINSVAAIWLVLILLEAMVSGSRRVVAVAAMLALGGAVLLMLADPAAPAIARQAGALAALAIVSVSLYATGIALGAERIARANSRRLVAQEERWRLLAGNMTDVVTRHGDGGRVLFASTNAYAVLGIAAGELQGLGLFDRIHIADRPAFLTDALRCIDARLGPQHRIPPPPAEARRRRGPLRLDRDAVQAARSAAAPERRRRRSRGGRDHARRVEAESPRSKP